MAQENPLHHSAAADHSSSLLYDDQVHPRLEWIRAHRLTRVSEASSVVNEEGKVH
jgi:hypothetical protein